MRHQTTLSDLGEPQVGGPTSRDRFAETLYHDRVLASFRPSPAFREQVWAKHILVPDNATALPC
jgi:hypothetical protein